MLNVELNNCNFFRRFLWISSFINASVSLTYFERMCSSVLLIKTRAFFLENAFVLFFILAATAVD